MRWILPLCGLLAGGTAWADAAGFYLQGHGGYGGKSVSELAPGGSDPGLGLTLGAEGGVKVLALTGYLSYDRYLDHGSVTRAILGFNGDLGLAGFRLTGRLGAGLFIDNGGVMTGGDANHTGMVARAGLGFDRKLSPMLWLGLGLDAEYFAVKVNDGLESRVHTGADALASLRLSFEVGI
jgi:hypothetical protein